MTGFSKHLKRPGLLLDTPILIAGLFLFEMIAILYHIIYHYKIFLVSIYERMLKPLHVSLTSQVFLGKSEQNVVMLLARPFSAYALGV